MENKPAWVYGVAAVVALSAAAMLIVAFLVADPVVAEDVRGSAGCPSPDIAPALLRSPPNAAAAARLWM